MELSVLKKAPAPDVAALAVPRAYPLTDILDPLKIILDTRKLQPNAQFEE